MLRDSKGRFVRYDPDFSEPLNMGGLTADEEPPIPNDPDYCAVHAVHAQYRTCEYCYRAAKILTCTCKITRPSAIIATGQAAQQAIRLRWIIRIQLGKQIIHTRMLCDLCYDDIEKP